MKALKLQVAHWPFSRKTSTRYSISSSKISANEATLTILTPLRFELQ